MSHDATRGTFGAIGGHRILGGVGIVALVSAVIAGVAVRGTSTPPSLAMRDRAIAPTPPRPKDG